MTELQPGERRAIYANPQRLTHDGIRLGGRIGRKAQIEKICDGERSAGEGDNPQRKKAPARPNERRHVEDEEHQCQSAPADKHEEESREKVLTKGRHAVHWMNYTRRKNLTTKVTKDTKLKRRLAMTIPKLLITGCNGLVGKILWRDLGDDFDLYGLDISSGQQSEKIFQADISNSEQVQSVFSRIPSLTYVIHLAGDPRVDASWDSVFPNNIGGTKNVYEAARLAGVKRIVFASSNHATGAYEGFPPSLHTKQNPTLITTHDPFRPDGFYGVSKAAGEAIARMYYELYGLESICLRIGSVTKDDDPSLNPRFESTWLSHKDLAQLARKSLTADVKFGIYYGVSNNKKRFWDISNAEVELGYQPEDDASKKP